MTITALASAAFERLDARAPVLTNLAQASLDRPAETPAARPLAAATLDNLDYHLHQVLLSDRGDAGAPGATAGQGQTGSTTAHPLIAQAEQNLNEHVQNTWSEPAIGRFSAFSNVF